MPAGMAATRQAGIAFDRRGSGEPLLLIHGTGGSRFHWKPVADELAKHRELLLVDLPGHGESDPPPAGTPHTAIGYALLLARLLDELGIDSAHAAGNSVGGWTSLELAKLGRARSVVALGPAGLWAKRDPITASGQLWMQHKMGRLLAPVMPTVLRSPFGRTIAMRATMAKPKQMPAEDAIEITRTFARTPTFDAHLAATRRARFKDGRDIRVPVTVAWSEKERLIPNRGRLRDELPEHTRFVTLAGCGHVPMWDDPDLVARTILEGTGAQSRSAAPAAGRAT